MDQDLQHHPVLWITRTTEGFEANGASAADFGHRLEIPGRGQPDGLFASWRWDGRQLTAEIDRYGMTPLFYYSDAKRIGISSSLVRLIETGGDRELDPAALSVFFRLGFFLGNDTPFLRIKQMSPGARLTWDGQMKLDVPPLPRPVTPAAPQEELIQTYNRLFQKAIEHRILPGEPFAVPLSGGRDSRHILLELCRQGHKPQFCVTLPSYPPKGDETQVARAVSQAMGVRHVAVRSLPRMEAELRKNRLTHFCADEHAWFTALTDYLPQKVGVVYDGIGGDVLSAGLFSDEEKLGWYRRGMLDILAQKIARYSRQSLERLFEPEFARACSYPTAIEQIVHELRKHQDTPNPIAAFYFWNRTRREIALMGLAMLPGLRYVFAPFLDHDLFDFLMGLPGELVSDHQFHNRTLQAAYPDYAALPYAAKSRRRALGHHLQLARRFTHYAAGAHPLWWQHRRSRIFAHWVPWFTLPTLYRKRRKWIHPMHLIYAVQLQLLAAGNGQAP